MVSKRLLEFSRRLRQGARVGNRRFAVRERRKIGNANVQANAQAGLGQRLRARQRAHQADVPTGSPAGYSQLFNLAF